VTAPRRFPPPWSVDLLPACYIMRNRDGRAPGLRLFRGRSRGRRAAASLLTRDEARQIAANVAKRRKGMSHVRPNTRALITF